MRELQFQTGRYQSLAPGAVSLSLSNEELVGHKKWGRLSDPSQEQ